jgi:tetratricopeptide (TPR) repeat protein
MPAASSPTSRAIALCEKYEKVFEPLLVTERAHVLIALADPASYDTVLADMDRVLGMRRTAEALHLRALARFGRHEPDLALRDADAALAVRPNYADALQLRGLSKAEIGDLTGARADFERVIVVAPHSALAQAAQEAIDALDGKGR